MNYDCRRVGELELKFRSYQPLIGELRMKRSFCTSARKCVLSMACAELLVILGLAY